MTEWFFSIRAWKTDPFLLKLYFSYPKRWQRCALPSSEKYPFTSLFCSSIGTKLGCKRPRASIRGFYLRTSKQASWKLCGVRTRNPYVRNKRIRRADTSAFAPSDFYTSMCVYPYAFMHICVINIQNMALSTSHEGKTLCVYLPSALKIATLCDWKSRIRMRKRTHIRAYGSVPYTFFIFVSYTHLG